MRADPEVSVVIPCLNEAETLGRCIEKARRALREGDVQGEVIVADNGSGDGSIEIAEEHGARVVRVAEPGYGAALMGGIEAARGRYVVMGDADDSYDWLELPKFVTRLREGFDLVQGCRLPAGGGRILPGAMPALHRVWGNPMFSFLARRLFDAKVHDIYCGLRGFTKQLYEDLSLRCTGMEFATEMIIKASLRPCRISEVPITLHPDGRTEHAPHLRTFADGWRTLRLFMLYCPRWLYVIPGLTLVVLAAAGYALVYAGATVGSARLGAHTLLVASLFLLMGYQTLLLGVFTKVFPLGEHMIAMDDRTRRLFESFTLERGLIVGALAFLAGTACLVTALMVWRSVGFGALDYESTMRLVIPGVTLCAIGFQTMLASFFISTLGMTRR